MTAENDSDERLMRQVAMGNRAHLEILVRRHASSLLTFIERMVGDKQRSEDLFQETFLRVWTKRHLYKFPRTFRAWLYQIAANCGREDFRRSPQPTVLIDETSEPLADDMSPADVLVAKETAVHVTAALQRLPEQQRMVAVLRIWNEMSFAEIGKVMRREEATARSPMHHALANMRKYLEPRLK